MPFKLPCSLDNLVKNLHENSGRKSLKSQKSETINNFRKNELSSESFRGNIECSLDTPAGIDRHKSQTIVLKVKKRWKNIFLHIFFKRFI